MTGLLLRASLRALPRRAVALHLTAALALVVVTWNGLDDDGVAVMALRGVAVLLAAALALAVDEATAPLLDATPTPMAQRAAARLFLCAAVVLPMWGLALAVATLRGTDVPLAALTVELAALAALAVAVPMALRRWWRWSEPAVVSGPLLLGALLAAGHLPQALVLLPASALDPTWNAAHLRWALVLAAALILLRLGLADPSTARTPRRLR